MAIEINQIQNAAKTLTHGSTAEEITAFITIATGLARDLLLARGWTAEQWNDYRKQLIAEEIAFIDAEIERYSPPTDPLPV